MDPPPPAQFNFKAAAGTSGNSQNVKATFGSTLPPTNAFGSSLFGKPSAFSLAAKQQNDEKSAPGPSGSLASRLTAAPKVPNPKSKELGFSAMGDRDNDKNKVSDIKEGMFKINRKAAFGQLERRRGREATPDDNPASKLSRIPFIPSPQLGAIPPPSVPSGVSLSQPMSRREPPMYNIRQGYDGGDDETDHAVRKEPPPSLFGAPVQPNSNIKAFPSMSNFNERPPPPGFGPKSIGEKAFQPLRASKARRSPAPTLAPAFKASGTEEGKLVQKLASLRGQVCPGDYERYMLLDERDKILCQLREINSPLVRRLERCEEMCTEKERYQRIVQKGSSPFECSIETGEVSHDMMVKQYARSAADQERPLPHELRSERIMNYTMCYLLHNILDVFPEYPEQKAAWYNFLWSRTRALRKEVTQLQMSDLPALNLVERCTRLHIVFGYVLCDLETEHFDAAMNNETLGKCLQTLRHLYEDFAKRGIPCDNEAEFRSYDVMLHMNDTNVLSQVLSYRNEVRQSQHVRLALQLASAFRDNNYCRFFRLLKSQATYLQCCISHKSFGAARSNAMNIMVNSYGRNAFPLEKLRNWLAFDSTEDLIEMLNVYGLRTESGSDHVMLSRDDLSLHMTVPIKLCQWINNKNQGKLSQAVYGPNLFQFFASRCDISNSFNHRSEYVTDKVLDAVLDGSDIPISNDPSAFSFSQSAGSLPMQAINEQKRKVDTERLKKLEIAKREQMVQKMMTGVIDQVVNGIIEEELIKAKILRKQLKAMEEANRRRKEQEMMMMQMELRRQEQERETARMIAERSEQEAVEQELMDIVRDEFFSERRIRQHMLTQKIVDRFLDNELNKAIDDEVMSICVSMVNEKEMIVEQLEGFRDRMARQWLQQFWDRWREWVRMKKEERNRRKEMVRECIPRWEAEEIANDLVRKYGKTDKHISPIRLLQTAPTNNLKINRFKKKRNDRIASSVFQQWRNYAKDRKMKRIIALKQQERENQFFKRFEQAEIFEPRFKFDAPKDLMRTEKRKSNVQQERATVIPEVFVSNTSLFVARRQLEDFEPEVEMPAELKEKMKRKRESFEKAWADHSIKKKKDEEMIAKETKTEAREISEISRAADNFLNEARRFELEMDIETQKMIARRVEDL